MRTNFREKIFKTVFFFIFAKINFREKTYFTYFAGIKFSELIKKDILPVAVIFFMRLKKEFTRLARKLICMIEIFKIFTRIKFPQFSEWAVH